MCLPPLSWSSPLNFPMQSFVSHCFLFKHIWPLKMRISQSSSMGQWYSFPKLCCFLTSSLTVSCTRYHITRWEPSEWGGGGILAFLRFLHLSGNIYIQTESWMQYKESVPYLIKKETSWKWTSWTELSVRSIGQLGKDLGKGHLTADRGEKWCGFWRAVHPSKRREEQEARLQKKVTDWTQPCFKVREVIFLLSATISFRKHSSNF